MLQLIFCLPAHLVPLQAAPTRIHEAQINPRAALVRAVD